MKRTVKKEPAKMVPYDFRLKEDRDAVFGKMLKLKDNYLDQYFAVVGFHEGYSILSIAVKTSPRAGYCADARDIDLFRFCLFADTGEPVGKEVKE